MSFDNLSMQPHEVREVAREIDRIASDLRAAQVRFADHAAPAAPGTDEVSVAVAHTTAKMGAAQRRLGDVAVADLAELARSMAAHAAAVQRQDGEHTITVRQAS